MAISFAGWGVVSGSGVTSITSVSTTIRVTSTVTEVVTSASISAVAIAVGAWVTASSVGWVGSLRQPMKRTAPNKTAGATIKYFL
jgi:hypothetical protein